MPSFLDHGHLLTCVGTCAISKTEAFKEARPSIFIGTPSFLESLILKQIIMSLPRDNYSDRPKTNTIIKFSLSVIHVS